MNRAHFIIEVILSYWRDKCLILIRILTSMHFFPRSWWILRVTEPPIIKLAVNEHRISSDNNNVIGVHEKSTHTASNPALLFKRCVQSIHVKNVSKMIIRQICFSLCNQKPTRDLTKSLRRQAMPFSYTFVDSAETIFQHHVMFRECRSEWSSEKKDATKRFDSVVWSLQRQRMQCLNNLNCISFSM